MQQADIRSLKVLWIKCDPVRLLLILGFFARVEYRLVDIGNVCVLLQASCWFLRLFAGGECALPTIN